MESSSYSTNSNLPDIIPADYLMHPLSATMLNRYWNDETITYFSDAAQPTLEALSPEELKQTASQFYNNESPPQNTDDIARHIGFAVCERTLEDLRQGAEKWRGIEFATDLLVNQLPDEALRRVQNQNKTRTA